ncbi:fructose 1,6-bisphosphatase [Candidatus Bathyarchaeota archaeon]|nr:fructose 1,6-bisphosphatase [Candidatus Bathyarchaeota archaeon]
MSSWPYTLRICAQRMKREILSLFGSAEAQTGFGVGAGGDVTKKIDLAAENALIETLQDSGVSCTLISEEAGTKEIGSNPSAYYVTADPLDGTTNAVRGAPFMAISLAVSKKPNLKDVETALVCDPVHNATYTAELGEGAFKNRKRIQSSSKASFEEAVVGVDFNTFKIRELLPRLFPLLEETKHLRHFGADALELCYVADGTIDAFIDLRGKLRVTDIAAAHLILREAGGIMVTPEGNELDAVLSATERVTFIAAANKTLCATIQHLLK